jgi:hypothetical protein
MGSIAFRGGSRRITLLFEPRFGRLARPEPDGNAKQTNQAGGGQKSGKSELADPSPCNSEIFFFRLRVFQQIKKPAIRSAVL